MTTVAFGCMHACGGAADDALLPLPCAGRLDLATPLGALARGLDGVVVLSCSPSECRHRRCDEDAGEACPASGAERVAEARALIALAGLSPKRVAHRVVRPGDDPVALARAWGEEVARLGPWVRVPLAPPSPDEAGGARPFVADRCARLFARVQAARGWRPGDGAPEAAGGDLLWLGCGEVRGAALGEGPGEAALGLWRRAGRPAGAVVRSRCCGRALQEAGDSEARAAVSRANADLIAATGARRVVAACQGCVGALAESARGVEVIGLGEWVVEAVPVAQGDATGPLALVAPALGPRAVDRAVEERLARAGVVRLDAPPLGDGGRELRGPALRAAVEDLARRAANLGATALVAASSHDGALWRAASSPGGWRTGPSVPIIDLPEALLRLAAPARPSKK